MKLVSLIFIFVLTIFIYIKFFKTTEVEVLSNKEINSQSYNSNIITDVEYISQDLKGNIYKINAKKSEIDKENTNILFLTDVNAILELVDYDDIKIKADFGKYNIINNETIFSKNVSVSYTDNLLTGEYLDFSIAKKSMNISRNIIYKNLKNTLFADNLEMDIETKDTKINMYENKKQIKIISNN